MENKLNNSTSKLLNYCYKYYNNHTNIFSNLSYGDYFLAEVNQTLDVFVKVPYSYIISDFLIDNLKDPENRAFYNFKNYQDYGELPLDKYRHEYCAVRVNINWGDLEEYKNGTRNKEDKNEEILPFRYSYALEEFIERNFVFFYPYTEVVKIDRDLVLK